MATCHFRLDVDSRLVPWLALAVAIAISGTVAPAHTRQVQSTASVAVAPQVSDGSTIGPALADSVLDPLHIPVTQRNLPISTTLRSVFSQSYANLVQSARANDPAAESELADRFLSGRGVKGDYAVGLSYAKQAAAQGNARGEFLVGLCMFNGWATAKDQNTAVDWWQKAGDQGYPDAQYFLGEHYLGKGFGSGIGDQIVYVQLFTAHHELKEAAKGRALRDSAADAGYAPAELEAGSAEIRDGKIDEGVSRLQSAAAQGSPAAYIALGDYFCHPRRRKSESADDFSHEQSRGFDAYQKAAAFDLGAGEEKVGDAYREGCSVPKDSAQAADWYRKAASAYLVRGVPLNAFLVLKEAAKLDDAESEAQLATLYDRGIGVKQNHRKASELFAKAGAQGNSQADLVAMNQDIDEGKATTAQLDAEAKDAQPPAPQVQAADSKSKGSGHGGWIAIAGIGAAGLASSYGADAMTSAKVGVTAAALTAKVTNADPNSPGTAMLTGAAEAANGQMTNPIQQAADQQSANMLALGAANDAARRSAAQQAAAQRAAQLQAQQQAEQQAAQQQQQQAADLTQQQASSSTSSETTNVGPEACPSTQNYPDGGANCNPVRNMANCIRVDSAQFRSDGNGSSLGEVDVAVTNTCSATIELEMWGSGNEGPSAELTTHLTAGAQYSWVNLHANDVYHFAADDGWDCTLSINPERPGCAERPVKTNTP